jgi:hypothetical protein
MMSFFNELPDLFKLHLLVGAIVFLVVWKSFAYRCTNRMSGYISGHPVSSYKDQGIQPTWFDYLLCLGWLPPMLVGWPIVLFFYIFGTKHSNDENLIE